MKNPRKLMTFAIWLNWFALVTNFIMIFVNAHAGKPYWVAANIALCLLAGYQLQRVRRIRKRWDELEY